jgi:sirohydrochlorin cobaltochelatase
MSAHPISLVLIAHGSVAAKNSNQPLFDLADRISQSGRFDVVTPAFLNGQPAITNVLDGLPPGDVVLVPVMTSEGYYLSALPDKLLQNSCPERFRFFVTRVVGLHDDLAGLISQRISMFHHRYRSPESDTTVVVVGHGTRRNKNSALATLRMTNQLIRIHPNLKFESAFLDQEPTARDVATKIQTANTLVVPFLISRGPHSTIDVPEAFGLQSGLDVEFPIVKQSRDGVCVCDLPVGMYPEMAEICLQLAIEKRSAGSPMELAEIAGGFES